MLGEDFTSGAVMYGIMLDLTEFTESASADDYDTFNRLTYQLRPYRHIVPGDTQDYVAYSDRPKQTMLGVPAGLFTVDDSPGLITLASINKAKATFEENLQKLRDLDHPVINAALENPPQLMFTTFGPLAYASLAIGKLIDSEEAEEAVYGFHSTQLMDQDWGEIGVDGVTITDVDDGFNKLDLDAERIERWKERVPDFEDPQIYISVRFD